MSTNKSISYLLYNKRIIVNLYKLYFPSFFFFLQPNKRVFHPPTFPPLQPNIQEGKLNIFHPPTFPSFHFSTPPTKRTLRVQQSKQLLILSLGECDWFTSMIFSSNDIVCKGLTTLVLELIPRRISMQLVTSVNNMSHGSIMSALWSAILVLSKVLGVTRLGS